MGERELMSLIGNKQNKDVQIVKAQQIASLVEKHSIVISDFARYMSKVTSGKPNIIENLRKHGKFSEYGNTYSSLDTLDGDDKQNVINAIISNYNENYVGKKAEGKHTKRLTGGRKTKRYSKKHRKTRKHRRNKTRGFTLF